MSNAINTLRTNIAGPVREGLTGHVNVASFARTFGLHPGDVRALVVREMHHVGRVVADGDWIRVYPF